MPCRVRRFFIGFAAAITAVNVKGDRLLMKTKKRFLSILLSLALVLGLMPGMSLTAYAREVTSYKLWVGGTQVTSDNLSGTGWSYNASNSTLTLDNYSYTGSGYKKAAIYCESALNIELINSNEVTSANNNSSRGIYVYGANLIIKGTGTLTANAGSSTGNDGRSAGIHTTRKLTIEGGATVNANGGTATSGESDGVLASRGVEVKNGTLIAKAETGSHSYGIAVGDNYFVEVSDKSSVIAIGDTNGVYGKVKNAIAGIGWTNIAGSTGMADIEVNNTGRALDYKNVQFPAYTVTYKVVNGTWSDGKTTDITETVARGSKPVKVPTGMKASDGYTGGAWDKNPAETSIKEATTFTYTFEAKSEVKYSTVSVTNGTHTIADGIDVVLTVKGEPDDSQTYDNFTGVEMDGKDISSNKYTTAKGSLILTLKAAYLDTLATGEHKVTINFKNGSATATLNIKAPLPKTGDSGNPLLWLGLMLLGIAGLAIPAVRKKFQ